MNSICEFVAEHYMKMKSIHSLKEANQLIEYIGSDPNSIPIMSPKMVHRVIEINDVVLQDAIIIKQDMLSIGGEVAVPKNTFDLHQKKATILVSGTVHQLRELIIKLKRHYSRIQQISQELEELVKTIT